MHMRTADAQVLLASALYYRGAIDGLTGPATRRAVGIVRRNGGHDWRGWSEARQLTAAGQAILNAQGFEAGAVDGWMGHNTREALVAWASARAGTSAAVPRSARPDAPAPMDLPRQSDVAAIYGDPERGEVERRLAWAEAPAPMRLDWALDVRTGRLRVHERCAPSLTAALAAVVHHYGEARWRTLGLDRYAGGHMHRRMRGGRAWSMHAYGCAVDFYAQPNGLRTRCPQALFCGEDYAPFLDIMEAHGWLPAIRLWGADAMHFQQARMG